MKTESLLRYGLLHLLWSSRPRLSDGGHLLLCTCGPNDNGGHWADKARMHQASHQDIKLVAGSRDTAC